MLFSVDACVKSMVNVAMVRNIAVVAIFVSG